MKTLSMKRLGDVMMDGNEATPQEVESMCVELRELRRSEEFARQHAAALEGERVTLSARLRKTAQIIIEGIGAHGPQNAEEAAERIVAALAASESARREAESERDTWKANYLEVVEGEPAKVRKALMDKAIDDCSRLRERAEQAQQSAAAMRERIDEVIADIDSHYSEVELATGETLIGSWREKLADLLPTPTPPRSRT